MDYLHGEAARTEGLYHLAVMHLPGDGKNRRFGLSRKGNSLLGAALREHGSFESVYGHFSSGQSIDDFAQGDTIFGSAFNRFKRVHEKTMNRANYVLVRKVDTAFPSSLTQFNDSPAALYCLGDLGHFDLPLMAVVGTRELQDSTVEAAESAVRRLVSSSRALNETDEKGYCIVSGLAKGSDTLGHRVAMQEGGRTIAVIGTDLSKFYPSENQKLQKRIAEEQLLVSQYPFGLTLPKGSGFVQRNYTVACLSKKGALIIEADDKSGTNHVIRHMAKDLNRPLYVLALNKDKGHKWLHKYKGSIRFV